ncbi:MAG: pseudouridine synthase [Bacilli bacterium]
MRLDKFLSFNRYGSRRHVKKLIREGVVSVNDKIIRNDDFIIDEENDVVRVFEEEVIYQKDIYIMLNKPQGVICATIDEFKKTVIDLLENVRKEGLIILGRLDKDTEGLLIITNNKSLQHELLSPKHHVAKKYYVEFSGTWQDDYINLFKEGIIIRESRGEYKTKASLIEKLDDNKAYLTLYEGRYHQVKKMFIALGLKVTYLKRVEFNNLKLDETLALGEYRNLTKEEIEILKKVL